MDMPHLPTLAAVARELALFREFMGDRKNFGAFLKELEKATAAYDTAAKEIVVGKNAAAMLQRAKQSAEKADADAQAMRKEADDHARAVKAQLERESDQLKRRQESFNTRCKTRDKTLEEREEDLARREAELVERMTETRKREQTVHRGEKRIAAMSEKLDVQRAAVNAAAKVLQ